MESDHTHTEAGFTLIEMVLVLAIAVPIISGIAFTTRLANETMVADSLNSEVSTHCHRMGQRISKLARPAQMHTILVQATQEDVVALRASTVGEWIGPSDLVWRTGFQFQSASGLLSMNAALSTSPRRIVFQLDSGETKNDVDDDGDGLIDEGEVILLQNTITLAILKDVEDCSFCLDGRVLKMRLRVARVSPSGRVYRASVEKHFYLRNN